MANKKLLMFKGILIALVLLYVLISCFSCTVTTTWSTWSADAEKNVSTKSNMSIVMLCTAALQILFVLLNRPLLQLPFGLFSLLPGACLPMYLSLLCAIEDQIMDVHVERQITPMGWTVTICSWVLVVANIALAVIWKIQKTKISKATTNNTDERDDSVI